MSLTVPLFRMYAEQAGNIKQDDLLMLLAIATNPHIKSEKQGRLWDMLKRRPKEKPRKEMSEEMKQEARAVLERMKGKPHGI